MNKLSSWISPLLILSFGAAAEPVVMSYDGFYDRMEVVNEGEYQYAQVGFYLKTYADAKPCDITEGEILTEKQSYSLTYNDKGQLFLPFDKELDTHKAMVVVTPADAGGCQLSMQIEAKMPQQGITAGQLYQVNEEFEELLADLSGFFVGTLMSFLLPEQQGIQLHFNGSVPTNVPTDWQCVDTRCKVTIKNKWQDSETVLVDGSKLARITPWIAK
ncbi:DUF2987 domain-containing protein [Pseudoalteromonas sp. BDTF-M6]|uniref:DUF2987 domain-containing protein n=1 Tax=Pseudoalteromonas sp. BDTF-M6 TaxID=2796132 RepID=UPI001BAFD37E|nr:DUF2987 domain-containing protein [Pseudoalteromonas sp. BDTF-M6]MBS3796914.1 DUF2987 domain-containing protein [Pseudoalteromonas sp. BDTF-M6]